MDEPLEFIPDDAKILGPRLKTFVWDFDSMKDQTWYHDAVWAHHFSDNEEAWLRQLATVAVGSTLQEIQIMFTPDTWDETYAEYAIDHEYPWHLMDDIRDLIMRPNGMNLTYNEPSIFWEEWMGNCESETDLGSCSESDDAPTKNKKGHGNLHGELVGDSTWNEENTDTHHRHIVSRGGSDTVNNYILFPYEIPLHSQTEEDHRLLPSNLNGRVLERGVSLARVVHAAQ
jgi:hypothetical protein